MKAAETKEIVPVFNDNGEFDIKATYFKFLEEDPDITMPVAAIESLVALLSTTESMSDVNFFSKSPLLIIALPSFNIFGTYEGPRWCDDQIEKECSKLHQFVGWLWSVYQICA